jgi:predicted O-methyltransferase YrrM
MNRPAIKYAMKEFGDRKSLILAELGVAFGINAASMLAEFPGIKKLVMVDPYVEFGNRDDNDFTSKEMQEKAKRVMLANVERFNDKVIFHECFSSDAARMYQDEFFDFVYIDGDHRYSAVKTDLELWYPKVSRGGFLAGHDYVKTTGVIKAVTEFAKKNNLGVITFCYDGNVTVDNSDWIIRKF